MRLRPLEAGRAGSARPPMARYGTLWQAHPRARSGSSVHASVNSPVLESASRSAFRCLLASSQPCRSPHGQASARPLPQVCPRLELPVFPIRPRPAHTPALTLPIRISPTSAHGSQNAPSGGHPSLRQTRPPLLARLPSAFPLLFSRHFQQAPSMPPSPARSRPAVQRVHLRPPSRRKSARKTPRSGGCTSSVQTLLTSVCVGATAAQLQPHIQVVRASLLMAPCLRVLAHDSVHSGETH